MTELYKFTASEWMAISLSLKSSTLSILLSLPFALVLGYIMARRHFAGKSVIDSFLHMPLVLPPVVTGYLLLLFFGTQGFLGRWLYELFGLKLPFSFTAAVISSSIVSFPLMVRAIRTSMEMVDPHLEEASRILGAGIIKTFVRITIPLSLPGIISGIILAFARSLGEFGATITFAGNIEGKTQTLPLAVYAYIQTPGKENATLRLVLISVIISFAAMVLSDLFTKKMKQV